MLLEGALHLLGCQGLAGLDVDGVGGGAGAFGDLFDLGAEKPRLPRSGYPWLQEVAEDGFCAEKPEPEMQRVSSFRVWKTWRNI